VRGRGGFSSGSKEPLNKNVICTYTVFIFKKALKMMFLLKTPETNNIFEIFCETFLIF
jgi:hypothetical protein